MPPSQRGIQVDQSGERFRHGRTFCHPRRADEQRHTRALFEQAHLLPQAVFAEVIAMVARKHNDRVVSKSEAVECIDNEGKWASLSMHSSA